MLLPGGLRRQEPFEVWQSVREETKRKKEEYVSRAQQEGIADFMQTTGHPC